MWMCRVLCGRRARMLRGVWIEWLLGWISVATIVWAASLWTRMSAAALTEAIAAVAPVDAPCLSSCSSHHVSP